MNRPCRDYSYLAHYRWLSEAFPGVIDLDGWIRFLHLNRHDDLVLTLAMAHRIRHKDESMLREILDSVMEGDIDDNSSGNAEQ